MKSMILKIFLAYWFAAGIIVLVSDFGPDWHPHNPVLADALNVSLMLHGRTLVSAYQAGTCKSDLLTVNDSTDGIYLATADGRIVCGDLRQSGIDQLVARTVQSHKLTTANYQHFLFFAIPITDSKGIQYVLLIRNHYPHQSQLYIHRPGNTSIEISCVVTFLLAVLIVYPIRRLRTVTHQIASGNLEVRLKTGWLSRLMTRLHLTDDLDRLMDDFNKMAERLQSAVAAQQLLLRDVTHELRSPLSRIAVALGSSRESDPSAVNIHLDRIENESIRLNNLIAQILAFSYIESISELPHTSVLSLNKIVQELLPDVQYEAESRDCRIFTTCMRETVVNGDPDMLRHAVENIVRNAIRYSPPRGTVEIHIDTEEYDNRSMAVVSVIDTGPGVSEDELKLILNPFYRAQKFHHGSTSGFGVGLAIADRAAHLHGGEIVARNKKDGGLIIDMFLPLSA